MKTISASLQCLQGQWWDVATYSFPAELSRLPRGEEDGGAGPGLGSSSRRVKVTWLVNQLLQLHFLCLFVHVYRSANASNNDPRLSFKIKTLPVPRHSIATQLERLQPNLSAHLHSQDIWKKEFWPNSPRQTTYWRVTAWPRLMPLEFLSCQSIYTLDHQRRPVPPQSQAEIVLGDLQAHRGSKRIGHHRKFGEIWQKLRFAIWDLEISTYSLVKIREEFNLDYQVDLASYALQGVIHRQPTR